MTFKDGDLAEVVKEIPWGGSKPVGTKVVIDGYPYEDEFDDYPEVASDLVDVSDPNGLWFGGDPMPVTHLRKIETKPLQTAKEIASDLHSSILDIDSIRVMEVGEQSEDGSTLYVVGKTPEGYAVSFNVTVHSVSRHYF